MDFSYFLYTMIFSKLDILMGYWFIIIPLIFIFSVIKNPNLILNIEDIYNDYFKPPPKGMVILDSIPHKNKNSARYQAIMTYLSLNHNKTIYRSHEVYYKKFNYNLDNAEIVKHFFRIDQNKDFVITPELFGRVETLQKQEKTLDNNMVLEDHYRIKIFSKVKTVPEIINFLDDLVETHEKLNLEKNLAKPTIVESVFNTKEDYFDHHVYRWESNVSFNNRFFENKDKILKQIDFFLNNPDYFEKKGIPYQLGILLHGIPGCGKTSFIKALAKKTNRHIIDIKLTNNINLSELKQLFLNEKLEDDLIIPINKRLYVLEDIDVMGEMVHKREKESELENDFEEIDSKKNFNKKLKQILSQNKETNNMSYLLNILDGIQENKGRIIIMTTNHIEKIDPAIIRPGRIDINLEFKPATKDIAEEILNHYWDSNVKLGFEYKPIPHCSIVEFCRSSETLEETLEKLKIK